MPLNTMQFLLIAKWFELSHVVEIQGVAGLYTFIYTILTPLFPMHTVIGGLYI